MGKRLRRIAAWIALAGVGWATLWPAVAAAHARAAREAMPLCPMAGMMVDPADGAPPEAPAIPGQGGRTHCPLCIMAFYGVFYAPPKAPPLTFCTRFVLFETHCAAMPFGLEVQLPESRAPPALRA